MSHADADAAVQQHRPAVEAYARLCCPDPEAAADLVMEASNRADTASIYYGARPETAWLPFLLAEVRRTAASWAEEESTAQVLTPDFRLWYRELASVFGGPGTMRPAEEASPVLQAFNALTDRARYALWHQVIEGEPDAGGEADAALDSLRDSYLRRLTDRAPNPECHHYSRMLGAIVRGTNQRTSDDLEIHLAVCPACSTGYGDLMLITRPSPARRVTLAGRLLLWGHEAYLAERARTRTLLPVVVPDAERRRPPKRRFPTAATGLAAVLATAAAAGVAAAIVPSLTTDSGTGAAAPPGVRASASRSVAGSPSPAGASPSPTETPSSATGAATITLRSSATGQCLQIAGGSALLSVKPAQAVCDSSTAQKWLVLDIEGDAVKLRNAASSLCLDIDGKRTKGAVVLQRPCAIGEQDQMWLLKVYKRSGYIVAVCKTNAALQLGLNGTGKTGAVVLAGAGDGTVGRFALDNGLK
jgi:DNA-directed RNA polymerase specialized sigma24 family protein